MLIRKCPHYVRIGDNDVNSTFDENYVDNIDKTSITGHTSHSYETYLEIICTSNLP